MCSINIGPGWNLSQQGLNTISENNTITDRNKLERNALNSDLKEIGLPVLSKELSKNQISQLVLQIQKIRNVSAPKANEDSQAAPRMLKMILTDGDSYVQAIESSPIHSISREKTPPGSKIFLNNVKIVNSFLLIDENNTKFLGGKVPHLCEKWEVAKSVQHCKRPTASLDGPPAWVNFGCRIKTSEDKAKLENNIKSSDQPKEISEFETSRQEAIAEVATGAIKKVFGSGIKQPVQSNPRNDSKTRNDAYKNKAKKEIKEKEVSDKPQKPSDKVSLFDFLEDKLNIPESKEVINQDYSPRTAFDNKKPNTSRNSYNENKKFNNSRENFAKNRPHENFHSKTPREVNKHVHQSNFNTNPQKTSNKNYDSSNRQHFKNETVQNYGESNFIRNEKERINDSWHYRAPEKEIANNSLQNTPMNNLTEGINKMSVNSEFASRSLRQHLNLNVKKTSSESKNWTNGDECLVRYWEDDKFYPAKILTSTDNTYVVQFKSYNNIEEVLKSDCMPLQHQNDDGDKRRHKGTLEFRKSTRKFPHS